MLGNCFWRPGFIEAQGPGLEGVQWYYKIEFDPIIGGQMLFGSQFTAVVLLDGSVVEPIVREAE